MNTTALKSLDVQHRKKFVLKTIDPGFFSYVRILSVRPPMVEVDDMAPNERRLARNQEVVHSTSMEHELECTSSSMHS